MFDIKNELKKTPNKPGVYIMENEFGDIIYIGKAKSLKKRLSSYFQNTNNQQAKVKAMVKNVYKFQYIIVANEVEALVLESNLIKKNKPKYNIILRDDKQYPFIKIVNEKFPRVIKVREKKADKSKYFGPYPNVYALNDTLNLIHTVFPLRTCNLNFNNKIKLKRPCLKYYIKQCKGPCIGKENEEDYNMYIGEIISILNGKTENLISNLKIKMQESSDKMEYEKAMKYRDAIRNIETIMEKQDITSVKVHDKDLIAIKTNENTSYIQMFFVREGKIIERESHKIDNLFHEKNELILSEFMKQYYLNKEIIPKQIFINEEVFEKEVINDFLDKNSNKKISIKIPVRGENKNLMDLLIENINDNIKKIQNNHIKSKKPIHDLEELLKVKDINRIEAYDISNISGKESVGSMVVVENGNLFKKDYRKFKIKTVYGPDDYKSMDEILNRRVNRYIISKDENSNDSFSKKPDLIIMDGGKGQVNIAEKVIRNFKLNIKVIGLVKDDKHKTRGIIFNNNEYNIDYSTELFRFIFKIQEEMHRFAINYHRSLLSKKMVDTELNKIKGLGPIRQKELLKKYKSINEISMASEEELTKVESINKTVAKSIVEYFKGA